MKLDAHTDFLISLLEKEKLEVKLIDTSSIKYTERPELIALKEEVFEDLEGIGKPPKSYPPIIFKIEDTYFTLDLFTEFNRYRLATLRSDLYDEFTAIDTQKYRLYCRNQETKCLQSAKHGALWANESSKFYFGESEENGDLSMNGSSAWKLRAFESFNLDLLLSSEKKKFIRFSLFDTLMVGGQLISLEQLLKSRTEKTQQVITSFLLRRLGIEIEESKGDHLFKS